MKVLSIQSKELDLSKPIIYPEPTTSSEVYFKYPVYKYMRDKLSNQINEEVCFTFWGFSNIYEAQEFDYNNESCMMYISDKLGIREYCTFNDNYICLELEIPEEYVYESDFYNYCDILSGEQEGDIDENRYGYLYPYTKNKTKQVIFPYIKQEWITRVITEIGESRQVLLKGILSSSFAYYQVSYETKTPLVKEDALKNEKLRDLYRKIALAISEEEEVLNEISNISQNDIESYSLEDYLKINKN